jgi:hypothetical protein
MAGRSGFDPRYRRKYFSSSFCVQTGAHPASCTVGTGGPFPSIKRGQTVTLTTHLHLVPRSRLSRSYTSFSPSAVVTCSGTALLCTVSCSYTFLSVVIHLYCVFLPQNNIGTRFTRIQNWKPYFFVLGT